MTTKKKKTSMQDIADHLGISKSAIAFALNNKKGVSEELRKKVFQAAKELNYLKLNIFEDSKKNKNILVLLPKYLMAPEVIGPFYNDILWGIEQMARINKHTAVITFLDIQDEIELTFPNILKEMEFSGIVTVGVIRKEYAAKLMTLNLPFAMMDNYYEEIKCNSVVTANLDGAFCSVKHLIDQGHRSIGFIGPIGLPYRTSSNYERWLGYSKAMDESGLPINHLHCLLKSVSYNCNEEEMENFVQALETFPTAWFCVNDNTAILLIQALKKRQLLVPEDISIAGFDDIEAAKIISPKLTTYRVNREIMCEIVVDLLLGKIAKSDRMLKISIHGDLIIRDSVSNCTVR